MNGRIATYVYVFPMGLFRPLPGSSARAPGWPGTRQVLNLRLNKRLEALEKKIPREKHDPRDELVKALARALRPDELELIRNAILQGNRRFDFPTELAEAYRHFEEVLESASMKITGRSSGPF